MTGQGVVSCGGEAASSLLVGWVCWVLPGWLGGGFVVLCSGCEVGWLG